MSQARQEKPADAWGQPISEARQRELQSGVLHKERFDLGPFDGVTLSGADVFWLAEQSEHEERDDVPYLHLEGANLIYAHLEGAQLRFAHLEGAHLESSHLEGAHLNSTSLGKATLWGAHLEGTRLDNARLQAADLSDAYLEGATLSGARLEGANLSGAHLEGVDLSDAHLEGATLKRAWFDSKTVLGHASVNSQTQFGDIHWNGVGAVDLTSATWNQVSLLGDEHSVGPRASVDDQEAVVRAYRQLAAQLRAQGMSEVADRFLYRAQLRQRRVLLRRGRIPQWLGSWFLALLAGYGFRPGRTILLYLFVVSGFALAFVAVVPSSAPPLSWNEALVMSLTAFHGRGFVASTFRPGDPLAALAAGEAVLGLLIEVSFIATFTQRFFNAQ